MSISIKHFQREAMKYILLSIAVITFLNLTGCASTSPKQTLISGLKNHENGETEEAISNFKKSCEVNDRSACYQLGLLLNEKDFKASMFYLDKACSLNNLKACSRLGWENLNLYHLKEARIAFEKSKSTNFNSQYGTAFLLSEENKKTEAKRLAQKLCDEHYLGGCHLLGWDFYKENDFKTAKNYFIKANSIGDLNWFLGKIEYKLGNFKQANIEFDKSCKKHNASGCRIQDYLKLEKMNTSFEASSIQKCKKADGKSCYNVGLENFLKNNLSTAYVYFEKACKLGSGEGCMEIHNKNRFSSPIDSIKILKDSCDKKLGSACLILYDIYIKYDHTITTDYLEKACNLGTGNGCLLMANDLWDKGLKAESFSYYEKGCKLGITSSCYYFEYLDRKDDTKEFIAKKFCDSKVEEACSDLASKYYEQENYAQAQKYYQLSCDLENLESCASSIEVKAKTDKNYNKTIPHYELCYKGYTKSCGMSADYLEEGKQFKEAKKLYERGCFLDDKRSCDFMGWLYSEENNTEKALDYYRQACDLGSIYSCNKL